MILKLNKGRYSVIEDTVIDVIMTSGITFEKVRFIGLTRTGDGVRCITEDGMTEFPRTGIEYIKESKPGQFPIVKRLGK